MLWPGIKILILLVLLFLFLDVNNALVCDGGLNLIGCLQLCTI